ncbi:MAG: hypothetical protein M3209_05885 [Acidobacteriota bacterium]|nr:hypothetical protein [Acidobacteriota bacterium]
MGRAKPIKNEKRPKVPVFLGATKLADSIPYKVQASDTWVTVARKYGMKPKELIYYNFHTNNTDEVNYYLREFVGCRVSTDGGRNWAFKDAAPGIIYIPIRRENMEGEVITAKRGVGGEIETGYSDSDFLDALSHALDIYGLVELYLGATEVPLLAFIEAGMIVVGTAAAIIGTPVAIGASHQEALNQISRGYFFDAFSIGLVMSADGASGAYIKGRYEKHFDSTFRHPVYPEKAKAFRDLYNLGLLIGIKQGKKFNTVDTVNFFKYLLSQLSENERADYGGNPEDWSQEKKRVYHERLAGIVKNKILQNNLKLKIN